MRVKLTRLQEPTSVSQHPLRTLTVEGDLIEEPAIGHSVCVVAESIDPTKDYRSVTTSKVVSMTKVDATTLVTTETGSVYEILNLEYGAP